MDFSLKMTAEELGKEFGMIAEGLDAEIQAAVANIAHSTHSAIIARLQADSHSAKNRQDYLRGLNINRLGDDAWLISLDGEWANKLEEGYEPYSMPKVLLKSNKVVQIGSRAGQPWARTAKAGHKYAAVPFEHKPFSKEPALGDLAKDLKKLTAKNMAGVEQRITKRFKDLEGNVVTGKVAVVEKANNPNFEGLVKYQHQYENTVQSTYMTFRMISENSTGWQHPGADGYHYFKEAEAYVEKELENIINSLF